MRPRRVRRHWRRAYGAYAGRIRDTEEALRLPELDNADECRGAYVMRRQVGEEIEFVALHLFESLAAVMAFAGDDYEVAIVPGEARSLLASFDPVAQHFDVRATPDNATLGCSSL